MVIKTADAISSEGRRERAITLSLLRLIYRGTRKIEKIDKK